jgi:NAD(P)-dependent dehydrogenase (short-subunit alcohol dehydrogenase family)
MFNNAGIAAGGPLLEWTPEQYQRVIAVNQNAVFYGIQAAARVMCEAGRGGVILNTGSVYGDLASLYTIGYQAAKAAVEVMTKVAALELAPHGIRVVNIAPGVVDTPMVDAYRKAGIIDAMAKKQMRGALVRPEDVARVVAFLASDAARCINGTTVFADDGYSAFK